ncbi:GvpL/GvpF family gas vesicle protein [Nocardia inohanensis]|uniref:GvpL/GvpF family gas vesicle protein n=1 Tax=Nocardia inohanensis TaxID=209246 RepID=UPI00082CD491|nr:GvpL/GvpF family gas vesicle protein [Nocardia inohanensis]
MSTTENPSNPVDPNTALLIYGIVPADAEPEVDGIGREPTPVHTVKHGQIAALVSEVPADQPLDRAEDLQAFSRVVDSLVGEMPVIPVRFGAALAGPDEVERELLEPNADRFRQALDELSGLAEYLVKGQYVEDVVLREILTENRQAAELRETIRTAPPELSRDARISLGETINAALEYKRQVDGQVMIEALQAFTEHLAIRPPTHEEEVADIAVLVPVAKQDELMRMINDLAEQWRGRVDMRVVGPLAAWDFVAAEGPDAS